MTPLKVVRILFTLRFWLSGGPFIFLFYDFSYVFCFMAKFQAEFGNAFEVFSDLAVKAKFATGLLTIAESIYLMNMLH